MYMIVTNVYHRHPCRPGWDGQFSGVILFLVGTLLGWPPPNHQDNHFWRRRWFINLHFSLSSWVAKSQQYRLLNQLKHFLLRCKPDQKSSSFCPDPPVVTRSTRHPLLEQLAREREQKMVELSCEAELVLGRTEAFLGTWEFQQPSTTTNGPKPTINH